VIAVMETGLAAPARFAAAFDQLHEAAAAQAYTSDFGNDDYRWGLRVLLQSMDYDPHFTEAGRATAWRQLVDALASRAIAFRSMRDNPGYADNAIRRPIVITGIPRTGTTALHKLMAVDPQFQGPEKWLLSAPMPRPPRESWPDSRWFRKEVDELNARFGATPELRAAHNMVAEEIDECLWLQRQSFVSHMWSCNWSAATYDTWWQAQTEAESYQYLRRGIQLIGMNDQNRGWLLKNPSHILHLDQLFAIFHDALVVQTHRDPAKAVPSLCALLMQAHSIMEVGRREERAHIMGMREAAKWAKGVREAGPVREAHRGQVMDVIHADFHAAPMAVVRRIYAFAGLELSPEVEAAMVERIAAKPEQSHGVHRYDVADFGLTENDIREQYRDYVDAFDLRPSKGSVGGNRA
jgi:hypothetical protein